MTAPLMTNPSIPGAHDIHRLELPNGITLLVRSNFNSSSVSISGILGAGSQLDPKQKLGLAHFTSLALMRGTGNADFQSIFERLESAGASLGFGASVHNTSVAGRSLAEDLPMLIDTMADCLLNPVFPEEYFERLKSQLLTGLAIRAQDTAEMSSLTFDKLLFPDHPYGVPEDGYPETIMCINRQDLVDFHAHHYSPRNMVMVVVGAVKPQDAFALFAERLSTWNNQHPQKIEKFPAADLPPKTRREDVYLAEKSQTDIVMGSLGPRRSAPEYLAALVGNNILGQFGMMGRIGDAVREKAGLAYYASTSINSWIECGSWEVSAGVNPVNTEKAIRLIIDELERFRNETVLPTELEDSQANFIGRLPLSLESNSGVANAILNLERFNLGLDYLQQYPELIRSVTAVQILDAAQKYLHPQRLVIATAGPSLDKGKTA